MSTNNENQYNIFQREVSIPYNSQSSEETFDVESSDEENDYSRLDQKLDYISITKINTKVLMQEEQNIRYIKDLKVAENIVNQITFPGRKRRASNYLESSKRKFARLDKGILKETDDAGEQLSKKETELQVEASVTAGVESNQKATVVSDVSTQTEKIISNKIMRLRLKRGVFRMLRKRGIDFKLRLYLAESKKGTSFSKKFSELITEECKGRFDQEKEVTKSYLFFFYRNIKESETGNITPEIYALTTGYAVSFVTKFAEKDFVGKIERRVLKFPYHKVSYRNVDGPVAMVAKTARSGHEILLSTWDYLGSLVSNRTRQIRDNSSLYSLPNMAFVTKTRKPIKSKFQMSDNKLKIMRMLNITHFGFLLDHFSKIFLNKETFLVKTDDKTETVIEGIKGEEEVEDPMFQMYDFFSVVTDKKVVDDLNVALCKVLQNSMKGEISKMYMTSEYSETWMKADNYKVQVKRPRKLKSTSGDSKKTCYKSIGTWNVIPSLDEVMATLKEKYADEFDLEWLEKVMVKFRHKQVPMKKCIFNRFSIEGNIGTYLYNHGIWLEIKAQYLYLVERDFVRILNPHLLKSEEVPFLLPWKHQGKEKNKAIGGNEKKMIFMHQPFDYKQMKPKLERHYQSFYKGNFFENVFRAVEQLCQKKPGIECDFQQFEKMSSETKIAYLYLWLECNLNEDSYNSAYTLLNMCLPDTDDTKIITCDKKLANKLEICDVMIANKNTTYLVHVKAEFGQPIRDVCSQIRNAAENIFRELTLPEGTGIIDTYWKVLTEAATNPTTHENVVKEILESITEVGFRKLFSNERNIVFVLACLDTRKKEDFSKDINLSEDAFVTDVIRNKIQNWPEVIAALTDNKFLTDKGGLTDKFILEGKNQKVEFIGTIKQWPCVEKEEDANEIYEVLMSGLSRSKSTVAKMEIIKLIQDFERYYVGDKQLQLKVFSIDKDF